MYTMIYHYHPLQTVKINIRGWTVSNKNEFNNRKYILITFSYSNFGNKIVLYV